MTWVRFDDGYPWHPKIQPLSDRHYRLANSAIFWSARNLTDGRIRADQLSLIPTKTRPTKADATALAAVSLWHQAGQTCPSDQCPASPGSPAPAPTDGWTGWIIHDYFDYQPTRQKVIADRAAKAERQRNWMAAKRGAGGASRPATGGATDAPGDPPLDTPVDVLLVPTPLPSPPRPAPEGKRGGDLPEAPPARRQAADAAAGPVSDEHNRAATADPHPNGRPVDPPTELLADVRKRLADASRRARRGTARPGAFKELAELTPDVPPLVEPEPEARP